jgi:hypothetical protein
MTHKPTVKDAMFRIRQMGLTVSRTEHGEFKVNLPVTHGGTEDTAYYTCDAQDAINTAAAMMLERMGTLS